LNVAGSSNALISARVILEADYERPPVASRRLLFWQVGGLLGRCVPCKIGGEKLMTIILPLEPQEEAKLIALAQEKG
jgi:hypothetical protein